jgi:hypothetical protein
MALKLEDRTEKHDLLEMESYILAYLKGEGIPMVKSYGYSGNWNVLVMELLGKSLEDYFTKCKEKFSLKTVVMIGLQMVSESFIIMS